MYYSKEFKRRNILLEETCEMNLDPSETIPDQAYPLGELLRRAALGQPISVFSPEYDEETDPDSADLENFDRTNTFGLDLTDTFPRLPKQPVGTEAVSEQGSPDSSPEDSTKGEADA